MLNFAASLIAGLSLLYSAKRLHDILLHFVLRWPMELFDTTPLGRIINRFSKDVDILDNVLPWVIISWMDMVFEVKRIGQMGFVVNR